MKITELVEGVEYQMIDGSTCRMDDGELIVKTSSDVWCKVETSYGRFNRMRFAECDFEPKIGERYYFPTFELAKSYNFYKWDGRSEVDRRIKACVGVYRTKEQAIKKAKELGWLE